jgi:outer membrane protein insertion porin family
MADGRPTLPRASCARPRPVWSLVLALALGLASGTARAEASDEPEDDGRGWYDVLDASPVVREFVFEGLSRIDAASVRDKIFTQIGRPLDRARLSEDLKRLWATGFFEDVRVVARPFEGDDAVVVLSFILVERPAVLGVDLELEGDAVSEDEIRKVIDIKARDTLDEAKVAANAQKIRDLYIEEGHFLAEVRHEVRRSPEGVRVVFITRGGAAVKVRKVEFTGNREVASDELKGIIATREGGWLDFLTGAGEFKSELFEQDRQRIQYFLLTRGYVESMVGKPRVMLSPDRRSMEIVIPLIEGPRYRTGELELEVVDGDWDVARDEVEELLTLEAGQWFDYGAMQNDVQAIAGAFRDRGYANATVATDHKVDPETRTFGVVFRIQKGEPVRIRRIEVRGNLSTRDEVIRREMKIFEGDVYSGSAVRRSQRRIMATGFFEPPRGPGDDGGVRIEMRPTGDRDSVDLVVTVKEKQTGTFQVGAGFSSLEQFILTAQISKENFLGRGQTLSAQLTLSGIRQLYSVSFFEPYFLDREVTFAFDLFNFQEDFVDFTRLRTGGNVTFGYRFTDEISLSGTYTLESVDATLRRTDIDIAKLRQSGLTSSVRGTLSWDTRNNRLFPTSGQFTTLSAELASSYLASQNEFWRVLGRSRWYFPLFWQFVLRLNGQVGWVEGFGDNPVPLFERFFVGGIFTVRGFQRNSIGERLYITSQPDGALDPITIGGTKQLILNAEIEFPILMDMGIRGVVFLDAGNAWGAEELMDPRVLRTSAGFGVRWNSPVGPLRFEWGFPLRPRTGEQRSMFEFTIGNSF